MNLKPFEIITALKNQTVTATANGYSLDSRDGAGVPKFETALVNFEVGAISGYVQSYIESNLTNAANNDLRFTATAAAGLGTAGDGITVAYTVPTADAAAEVVTVTGRAISVMLRAASMAASTYSTTLVGDNNDFVLTAKNKGVIGDLISITLVDPSANDAVLAVTVSGVDISVSLATGGAGAITSTASEVIAAITAHAGASALVTAALKGADTGAVAVTALAKTQLASGSNGTLSTAAQVKAAIEASAAATALVTVTTKGSETMAGVVTTMAAITTTAGANRKAVTITVQESDVAANASANTTCATVNGGTATQVAVASTSYKFLIKRTKRYVRAIVTVAETGEAISGAICAQLMTFDSAELPLITPSSVLNA